MMYHVVHINIHRGGVETPASPIFVISDSACVI
jgi:hypothetical protein